MTQKEALELAIKVLNDIPNSKTKYGMLYDIISKLEKALIESEINMNTPFGPKWVLSDILFIAENLEEDITLEEAYQISKTIETEVDYEEEEIAGISNYLIEKKILAFLKNKREKEE